MLQLCSCRRIYVLLQGNISCCALTGLLPSKICACICIGCLIAALVSQRPTNVFVVHRSAGAAHALEQAAGIGTVGASHYR